MARSSSKKKNTRMVEATAGELVWVQRRNGSWWPGQIIGLDEVSENHLASSGCGTPIRLLCRDDVPMEWHNLEISKQVKAFRCGDHDVCIEKAKAAAASASKKPVKLTKRESGILLALELESALLFKAQENNCSAPDNLEGDPCSSDCMSEETSAFDENSNSAHEMSHSGISYEETNGTSHVKGQPAAGKKRPTNESEDEGSDIIKRMRGLHDLGHGMKVDPSGLIDAVSQGGSLVNNSHCVSIGNLVNGSRVTMPSFKKKRSQSAHNHEGSKRRHRRRTLTKVLDTLVTVPVIFDEFGDGEVLGVEPNEAKRTLPLGIDTMDSSLPSANENGLVENLFDVPIYTEELHAGLSTSSLKLHNCDFGRTDQNCKVETASGNDAPSELDSTSPPSFDLLARNLDQSTSNWQMKGRRNLRHSSKVECLDEDPDDSNALADSADLIDPFSPSRARTLSHIEEESPERSLYTDMVLYDVNIEVKASYRPHHVPYISLMSKLNGKAITGHPVTVEIMDDIVDEDYHGSLLDSSDYNPTSSDREAVDDEEADMDFVIKPKGANLLKPNKGRSSKSNKHRSSSKKTRRLSALTKSRKLSHKKSKSVVQARSGPTLACIPLKIVFSRINEALSGLSRHRCMQSGNI